MSLLALIIILAIEPQKYVEVLMNIKNIDFSNKVIISLVPGKDITYLKSVFKNAYIFEFVKAFVEKAKEYGIEEEKAKAMALTAAKNFKKRNNY